MIGKKIALLCLICSSFVFASEEGVVKYATKQPSESCLQMLQFVNEIRDPNHIRRLIERRAVDFSEDRANPYNSHVISLWNLAYTHCALSQLASGDSLAKVLCMKEDEKIDPYFGGNTDRRKKEIDNEWRRFVKEGRGV